MKTLSQEATDRLACLYRHRVLTPELLRRMAAPEVQLQTVHRTLRGLEEDGLAARIPGRRYPHGQDPDQWYVTLQGAELVTEAGLAPERHWLLDPDRSTVLHDHLLLTNHVFALLLAASRKRSYEMDWTDAEHEVGIAYSSSQMVVADLVCHFTRDETRWLIVEIERGTHSLMDTARKIQQWHLASNAGDVKNAWHRRLPTREFPDLLFVFTDPDTLRKVKARAPSYKDMTVLAATVEDMCDPFAADALVEL